MTSGKNQIVRNVQAIVNIIAGTASLEQEYQTTVYVSCTCSNCFRAYWTLTKNRLQYLSDYPCCANCGSHIKSSDIIEDPDVIGAEVMFLQKNNTAYASFKLTHKALETSSIKDMIKICTARFIW